MHGYFITGTDTGVGKTFVATHLVRRARAHGHRVFGFKPFETGCEPPLGDDQRLLCEAAGDWQLGPLCGVYQLSLPAAPLVAARAANLSIDVPFVMRTFELGSASTTFSVVEGAGGWRVPITDDLDMGGFAKLLGLPVLLVARATLGTINHTALSIEAIRRDGCEVAAVILSRRPDDDPTLLESNIEQIARHGVPVLVLGSDSSVLDRFT